MPPGSQSGQEWLYSKQLNVYYYLDEQSNQYVARDGRRFNIQAPGPAPAPPGQTIPRTIRQLADASTSYQDHPQPDTGYSTSNAQAQQPVYSSGSVTVLGNTATNTLAQQMGAMNLRSQNLGIGQTQTSRADQQQPEAPPPQQPWREFRDPTSGVTTRIGRAPSQGSVGLQRPPGLRLFGSPGDEEPLNPAFKKKDTPRKFFTIGRVFLILWTEPMGESSPAVPSLATYRQEMPLRGKFGEKVYSKVRRFVVIREGEQSCSALPIRTYNGRGAGSRPDQSANGIVFIGKTEPTRPYSEPRLQTTPIRIDPDKRDDKLDVLSRINYGTVYTIEHNLKVNSLGMVNRDYVKPLLDQFTAVWISKVGKSQRAGQPAVTVFRQVGLPQDNAEPSSSRDESGNNAPPPCHSGRESLMENGRRHIDLANEIERGRGTRPPRDTRVESVQDANSQSDALAELTADERQHLVDIFQRAVTLLTGRGRSETQAKIEAKEIVSTELAKLVSNARDRSLASAARAVNKPRRSEDSIVAGSAQGTSHMQAPPRSGTQQGRRPSGTGSRPNLSEQQWPSNPVRQRSAQEQQELFRRKLATAQINQSADTSRSQQSVPQAHISAGQQPREESAQLPANDSIPRQGTAPQLPTIDDLMRRGWQEKEAIAMRTLLGDGWATSSAQTIINLLRRNIPIDQAKRIAGLVDQGMSLEDAIRRVQREAADTQRTAATSSRKGKGIE